MCLFKSEKLGAQIAPFQTRPSTFYKGGQLTKPVIIVKIFSDVDEKCMHAWPCTTFTEVHVAIGGGSCRQLGGLTQTKLNYACKYSNNGHTL